MFANLLFVVAMAGGQGGKGGDSPFGFLFPMIIIFVIMYLFIFAPQRRKQKEHQQMMSNLKHGDKVMTAGGIIGIVASVKDKDNTVVLKVGENTKLEFSRSSIAQKIDPQKDAAKGTKK